MQAKELGPISVSMFQRGEGEAPAIIREWGGRLSTPGEFVSYWAGVIHRRQRGDLGWGCLTMYFGRPGAGQAPIQEMSSSAVERLLAPLAHEGRVRIMQALFGDPLSPSELSKATGFQGGGLYHHLRELEHADYIASEGGKYRLTNLGCELLVTVLSMANAVIEDRGERGLGVGAQWQERAEQKSP